MANCKADVVWVIEMAAASARAADAHATPNDICLKSGARPSPAEPLVAFRRRFRRARGISPIVNVHPAAAMSQRRILFCSVRAKLNRLLPEALASGPEIVVLTPPVSFAPNPSAEAPGVVEQRKFGEVPAQSPGVYLEIDQYHSKSTYQNSQRARQYLLTPQNRELAHC